MVTWAETRILENMMYLTTVISVYLISTVTSSNSSFPRSKKSDRATWQQSENNDDTIKYVGTVSAIKSNNPSPMEESNPGQEPYENKDEPSIEEVKPTTNHRAYFDDLDRLWKVQWKDSNEPDQEEIGGPWSLVQYTECRKTKPNHPAGSSSPDRRYKLVNVVKGMINKIKQKNKFKLNVGRNRGKNKTYVSQTRSVPPRNYSIVQNLKLQQLGLKGEDVLTEYSGDTILLTPFRESTKQNLKSKTNHKSENACTTNKSAEYGNQRGAQDNTLEHTKKSSKQFDPFTDTKFKCVAEGNQVLRKIKCKPITSNEICVKLLTNISHNSLQNSNFKKTPISHSNVKKTTKRIKSELDLEKKPKHIMRKNIITSRKKGKRHKGRDLRKNMKNQMGKFTNDPNGVCSKLKGHSKETLMAITTTGRISPGDITTNVPGDFVRQANEIQNITCSSSITNKSQLTIDNLQKQPNNSSLGGNNVTSNNYRHSNTAEIDATEKYKYCSTQSHQLYTQNEILTICDNISLSNKITDEKIESLDKTKKENNEHMNGESLIENITELETKLGSISNQQLKTTKKLDSSVNEHLKTLEIENLDSEETRHPLNKEENWKKYKNGKVRKNPKRRLPVSKKRIEAGGHHRMYGCTPGVKSRSLFDWLNPWAKLSDY